MTATFIHFLFLNNMFPSMSVKYPKPTSSILVASSNGDAAFTRNPIVHVVENVFLSVEARHEKSFYSK